MSSSSSSSSSSNDIDTFIMTGGKKSPYFCSYCKRDITQDFRVKCNFCVDFNLCADCFTSGVKLSPHLPTHPYRIVDCLSFPLFSKDWSAAEELLMLEGIEKCGVGNWKLIADYIGNGKTTKNVEEHYWETFMGVHGYCLPIETLDADKNPIPTQNFIAATDFNEGDLYSSTAPLNRIPVVSRYSLGEKVERDKGKETKAKDKSEIQQKIGTLPGSDLTGFIPLREDFDIEYENDAELTLADMEFHPEDHPSEKELKLQVIQIYNHKLTERDRRKRFVIDRGLVDNKKQMSLDRKRTKEERELVAKLRVFARFHSAAEHEALVEGMLKAKRLRQQIALYQHYRRMGIRTLDQARSYEVDKKKRETENKSRKQGKDAPYVYENGRQSSTGLKKAKRRGGEEEDDKKNDSNSLDISKAPGAELLADKEIDLCARVPMLPMHYLAAKDAIVREAYRNGTLTSDGVKRLLKLDPSKTDKIFDFFVREMTIPLSEEERSKRQRI